MEADEGAVIEVGAVAHRFMFELAARLAKQGGAALFLDYGHAVSGFGDTLQALRAHTPVSPLSQPGECDLTAHVDFAAMARSARAAGATVHGPIDQGDFLRALGVDVRARALGERSPVRAGEIEAARRRLFGKGENEMGALFKAMAVANRAVQRRPASSPTANRSDRRRIPQRRDARTAWRRACVLHPPRRRIRGRLRDAQRRRRLARRTRRSRRQPRPHGGGDQGCARAPGDPLPGPLARRAGDYGAVPARSAAALRRAGHRDARAWPRRHRRGLRHDPVRRRRSARDRRRARRLEGRAQRRPRSDGRRDGGARGAGRSHQRGARPLHRPAVV